MWERTIPEHSSQALIEITRGNFESKDKLELGDIISQVTPSCQKVANQNRSRQQPNKVYFNAHNT